MTKRVMADYYGHEIIVENTWLRGARLFVDGECCDENHNLVSIQKDVPLLKTTFYDNEKSRTVEVFVVAFLTVKIKICVDGKQIGGELF